MSEECCGKQCGCPAGEKGAEGWNGDDNPLNMANHLLAEEQQNAKNFKQLCYIGGGLLLILGALLIKLFYGN